MIVSIIGSDGRLGTSLKKVMNNRLGYVYCNSKHCDEDAIMESDVSVLAVPITETIKILDRYYTKKLILKRARLKHLLENIKDILFQYTRSLDHYHMKNARKFW